MQEVDNSSRSKFFIETPDQWPMWPQLPLINRETKKAGFLLEGSREVFLGNVWDAEDLDSMESIIYNSVEEIVDAGWEVD